MTNTTAKKIDDFILAALHDPARREVLLGHLMQAGFPATSPATSDEQNQ